ncbi:hypothetical protein HDU96_007856, partial [Phlyctochytrium bullatum]
LRKQAHHFSVTTVAWYPLDHGLFVSGSLDQSVRVWDATAVESVCAMDLGERVHQVAFSRFPGCTHAMVAVATAGSVVRGCDLRTGTVGVSLAGHGAGVLGVAWGERREVEVVSCSMDSTIKVWDIRKYKHPVRSMDVRTAPTIDLAGAVAEHLGATRGRGRGRGRGKTAKSAGTPARARHVAVNAIKFLPGTDVVVSADVEGQLRKWDVGTGELIQTRIPMVFENKHTSPISFAVVPFEAPWPRSTRMHLAAVPCEDERVFVFDLETGELMRDMACHWGRVGCVEARVGAQVYENKYVPPPPAPRPVTVVPPEPATEAPSPAIATTPPSNPFLATAPAPTPTAAARRRPQPASSSPKPRPLSGAPSLTELRAAARPPRIISMVIPAAPAERLAVPAGGSGRPMAPALEKSLRRGVKEAEAAGGAGASPAARRTAAAVGSSAQAPRASSGSPSPVVAGATRRTSAAVGSPAAAPRASSGSVTPLSTATARRTSMVASPTAAPRASSGSTTPLSTATAKRTSMVASPTAAPRAGAASAGKAQTTPVPRALASPVASGSGSVTRRADSPRALASPMASGSASVARRGQPAKTSPVSTTGKRPAEAEAASPARRARVERETTVGDKRARRGEEEEEGSGTRSKRGRREGKDKDESEWEDAFEDAEFGWDDIEPDELESFCLHAAQKELNNSYPFLASLFPLEYGPGKATSEDVDDLLPEMAPELRELREAAILQTARKVADKIVAGKNLPRRFSLRKSGKVYDVPEINQEIEAALSEFTEAKVVEALAADLKAKVTASGELSSKLAGISTDAFSYRGLKPANEDRVVCIPNVAALFGEADADKFANTGLFAVYDGHGGEACVEYIRTHLHMNVLKHDKFFEDIDVALKEAFMSTNDKYRRALTREKQDSNSGSTATLGIIRDKTLYLAWTGDSPAFLLTDDATTTFLLNPPHNSKVASERGRVEALGGMFLKDNTVYRLNGLVTVTRSFGDFRINCMTAEPSIITIPLSAAAPTSTDADASATPATTPESAAPWAYRYLVISSDGLTDVMSPEDVWKAIRVREDPSLGEVLGTFSFDDPSQGEGAKEVPSVEGTYFVEGEAIKSVPAFGTYPEKATVPMTGRLPIGTCEHITQAAVDFKTSMDNAGSQAHVNPGSKEAERAHRESLVFMPKPIVANPTHMDGSNLRAVEHDGSSASTTPRRFPSEKQSHRSSMYSQERRSLGIVEQLEHWASITGSGRADSHLASGSAGRIEGAIVSPASSSSPSQDASLLLLDGMGSPPYAPGAIADSGIGSSLETMSPVHAKIGDAALQANWSADGRDPGAPLSSPGHLTPLNANTPPPLRRVMTPTVVVEMPAEEVAAAIAAGDRGRALAKTYGGVGSQPVIEFAKLAEDEKIQESKLTECRCGSWW